MKTIEATLNATVTHRFPKDYDYFGKMLKNGTAIGSIGELYYKKIDMCFNQMFLKDYNVSTLQFTSYIFSDSLCILVPAAGKEPKWKVIFECFTLNIWLLMIITFISSSIALVFIRKLKTVKATPYLKIQHSFKPSIQLAVTDVWQVFFSTPSDKMTSNTGPERLFMGMLLTYVLLINITSFQSVLVTTITTPKNLPEIDSLDDLANAGFLIKTSSSSLMDTFNSTRPTMQILNKKLTLVNDSDPTVFKSKLIRKMKNDFLEMLSVKVNGSSSTHMVKECPQQYILTYLMHKESPFYKDFNEIIARLVSSGLVGKWYKDTLVNATLDAPTNPNVFDEPKIRPFSINELQSSFYILVIGLAIGIIIFFIEIVSLKLKVAI